MKIHNKLKNTFPKVIHANGVWHESVKNILNKKNIIFKQGTGYECFYHNGEEINTQSDLFRFNHDNVPLNETIAIYTWNNKSAKDKWIFEIICEINNLKYTNLVGSTQFTTLDKLITINREIKRLISENSNVKYVFCCDSKDVMFFDHPNNFINDFLVEKSYGIVLNAETNDYPSNITSIEQANVYPFKYLNSGAYIAEVNFLEKFTDYAISLIDEYRLKYSNDPHCLDQLLFKKAYEMFQSECLLDCNSELFLCLYGCNQDWLDFI